MLRKGYDFAKIIIGIILVLIPITFVISPPYSQITYQNLKTFSTISGLSGGGVGTFLIANGYYKITEKLKEHDISEFMNLKETDGKK